MSSPKTDADGDTNGLSLADRKGEKVSEAKPQRLQHYSIGVWDLYVRQRNAGESIWKTRISWGCIFGRFISAFRDWRYLYRSVVELWPSCWKIFVVYIIMTFVTSLMPALGLWFSSQLLKIVEEAVTHRTVNERWLLQIACGRIVAHLIQRTAEQVKQNLYNTLQRRVGRHYAVHILRMSARLDVPTFNDPLIARHKTFLDEGANSEYMLCTAVPQVLYLLSLVLNLGSEIVVLVDAVWTKMDGPLLVGISTLQYVLPMIVPASWQYSGAKELLGKDWAVTTRDQEYLRMEGYKAIVKESYYRKELVASGLGEFIANECERIGKQLGSGADDIYTFFDKRRGNKISFVPLVLESLSHLPQLVFALRAVRYPSSIPLSIATLELLQSSTNNVFENVISLQRQLSIISISLSHVRDLYEAADIENKVKDGNVPFPEDAQSLRFGVALEFRNVSFKYPGSTSFALRNISFKIRPGQLCVIVGSNGSGKSTVLSLIPRIYDVTEGAILLDEKDISTLKLADLRRAMSILFQDYSHFPLSIKDNIGIGDPTHNQNEDRIREAARMGSAETLIEKLPQKYDTFIERPVDDKYVFIDLEAKDKFRKVLEEMGERVSLVGTRLSGGQMQRLAVARTLMRTLPSDEGELEKDGLLLFDEPSAALDPTAENDLFTRLRALRGNKTMVFSTHRFGNLTRHADLILYMDDAQILEAGTHKELLARNGDYARLWKIQAQAFL